MIVIDRIHNFVFSHLSSRLAKQLVGSAVGSFGLKLLSVALNLGLSIFLARTLGAEGFGTYAYIVAMLTMLMIPATLGLDRLLVREIAIYRGSDQAQCIKGIISWSFRITLVVSVALGLLASLVFWQLPLFKVNGAHSTGFLWLAFLTLPLLCLNSLQEGALKGFSDVVVGQISGSVVAPGVLLLGSLAFYRFFPGFFNPQYSLAIYAIAAVMALLSSTFLLKRRYTANPSIEPAYSCTVWLSSSLPLMLLTVMQILNVRVDLLMLGAMSGVESVGVYVVVTRLTQQMYLITAVIGVVLLPSIAGLYSTGDRAKLQRLITASSRASIAISSVFGLGLFLFSDTLLLLFGDDFQSGGLTLDILVVGQIVNISLGAVGSILTMTSNEKFLVISIGVSTVMNIALNYLLIPVMNIEGAAIATTTSLIVWNFMSYYFVRKQTGIEPSFLGLRRTG